jgi:hypothetical protein
MEQFRIGNNYNTGYQGGTIKDVDAINVDGMHHNATKLHPHKYKRRYIEGLCFNYNQAGHVSRAYHNST